VFSRLTGGSIVKLPIVFSSKHSASRWLIPLVGARRRFQDRHYFAVPDIDQRIGPPPAAWRPLLRWQARITFDPHLDCRAAHTKKLEREGRSRSVRDGHRDWPGIRVHRGGIERMHQSDTLKLTASNHCARMAATRPQKHASSVNCPHLSPTPSASPGKARPQQAKSDTAFETHDAYEWDADT
jgi:hypothetical protein